MATFDSAQVSDLAGFFGTNSEAMNNHLVYYADLITDDDKANVLTALTAVEAAFTDVVSIEPNVENLGARINAGTLESKYLRQIAGWIHWPLNSFAMSGVTQLVRA